MGNQFREVEETFALLRQKFNDRRISQREYVDSLKQLRIKDDEGRFWMIGARSGKWYAFESGEWVEAKPPSQLERKAICIACGFENDLEAEFCARCGNRGEDEVGKSPEPSDAARPASPEEAVLSPAGPEFVIRFLHPAWDQYARWAAICGLVLASPNYFRSVTAQMKTRRSRARSVRSSRVSASPLRWVWTSRHRRC